MYCCQCGEQFGYDTPGVIIEMVAAVQGPKSGRVVAQECPFPDGMEKKFVCMECMRSSDLGDALEVNMLGYDFPWVIHGTL